MKTIQEEDLQLLKMEGEKSPDIARQSHALQLLLCREGSLTVRIDGEAQTIRPDQLLISFPGETWEAVSREHPFQGYLMSISQELLSEFLVMSPARWQHSLLLREKHLLLPDERNIRTFMAYFHLLSEHQKHSPLSKTGDKMLYMLLECFIGDLCDLLLRPQNPTNSPDYSATELLFSRFIRMLSLPGIRKHSVEYYADKLFVSPKYLTTVCKRLTGQPATAFINQYLVREIRYQLRNPNKSIQEIGYDLGFANPSFFGKFVKEHLGMTASQLREKLPI